MSTYDEIILTGIITFFATVIATLLAVWLAKKLPKLFKKGGKMTGYWKGEGQQYYINKDGKLDPDEKFKIKAELKESGRKVQFKVKYSNERRDSIVLGNGEEHEDYILFKYFNAGRRIRNFGTGIFFLTGKGRIRGCTVGRAQEEPLFAFTIFEMEESM